MTDAVLTPREVAELSGARRHVIEKAIEERVVPVRAGRGNGRRMVPAEAVVYATVVGKLDVALAKVHKKRLFGKLKGMNPRVVRTARIEVAPAVVIDVGRLAGDVAERAERYRAVRDASIKVDDRIMGGAPVIRGTRVTVHSLLGRVEHGDSIDDILSDNPDLKREVVEAALTYARTHPPMGRPAGRTWSKA